MVGMSKVNLDEVAVIQKIVRSLVQRGHMDAEDIAVLTPYDAQRLALREALDYPEMFIDSIEKA